ncbi:hypothetical protein M8C21_007995 [Ambrosia artemisiifolia]|uniref:Transcription factor-like protein DPB n=1 Tax=Ambrosia artemisiifolia TaxID=4212 RepID=A0AAD5G2D8_AMBAR|nr:hypothetical protein M8C21_007995 [Ambrosia artemisiifolia]
MGLNNNHLSRGRSWGTTASGQSVSTSGSVGSPSSRSEAAAHKLNHLDIHADDDAGSHGAVGSMKKKRAPRATGGDKNGRGLRQFSMKVCEKVESKGRTTYNEVADELVAEFGDPGNGVQASDQPQYDEKNIRRRVYDALNVLMALDIISKDKKEIHWKGLPQSSLTSIEELKKNRLALQSRFEKKSAYLRELQDQNLIQRNEQLYSSGNVPTGGVALPFILVQTRPHATVEVEISEDMQLVHFDFNSTPFEIHDDNHVLKAMKLCDQSKGGDDIPNNKPMDGDACSSPSPTLHPPSALTLQTTIPSTRPSTSPPLPGILKARVKHEQ